MFLRFLKHDASAGLIKPTESDMLDNKSHSFLTDTHVVLLFYLTHHQTQPFQQVFLYFEDVVVSKDFGSLQMQRGLAISEHKVIQMLKYFVQCQHIHLVAANLILHCLQEAGRLSGRNLRLKSPHQKSTELAEVLVVQFAVPLFQFLGALPRVGFKAFAWVTAVLNTGEDVAT